MYFKTKSTGTCLDGGGMVMEERISSDQFSPVAQSCPTPWPHEPQRARPPCPSPAPGAHSDSRPSSHRCHPAISSSVVPFSSCSQSLPASESFPMSQLFAWGGQSTGILLNHKKWNNAIRSNMVGPRDFHTKWSESEKDMMPLIGGYQRGVHINLFTKQTCSGTEEKHGSQKRRAGGKIGAWG